MCVWKDSLKPFSRRERATEPLGIVHSDVCGKSVHHHLVITCNTPSSSSMTNTLCRELCCKPQTRMFPGVESTCEMSLGYKVKKFRTDNGSEYTSTHFEEYLNKEGIEHHSVHYSEDTTTDRCI